MTMVRKMSCSACNGRGSSTSHIEPDGGGFTSNEWSEMDDEFREGYFAGHYDRRCNVCNGTGKVDYVEFDECQVCNEPFDKPQIEPYCSESCYWDDFSCDCHKPMCGYCA